MRFFILILLLMPIESSLGFHIETPESRAEEEKARAEWITKTRERFSYPHLRTFLSSAIKQHPILNGIELKSCPTSDEWAEGDHSLHCGSWTLTYWSFESPEFEITWLVKDVPDADGNGGVWHKIIFKCERSTRESFNVKDAAYQKEEYVTISA